MLRIVSAYFILKFHEPCEKSIPVMIRFVGHAVLKHMSLGRLVLPITIKGKVILNWGKARIEFQ